jgi:hypothetical protein
MRMNRCMVLIMAALCFYGCTILQRPLEGRGCPHRGVPLTLRINKSRVALNEEVTFGLCSAQDGFVTLWSTGSGARVGRLYPRSFDSAEPVRAGQPYVVGKFRVRGPIGPHSVYGVWTRTQDTQPFGSTMCHDDAVIDTRGDRSKRQSAQNCITARVTFEVTE